jgi:hypothetical protein
MEMFILRRAWKNDIFKCVREAGLNPLSFEWGEERTELESGRYAVSVLKYLDSDFYFKFDRTSDGNFAFRCYPGRRGVPEESTILEDWSEILLNFKEWLSLLKEDVTLDLWEQLKEYAPQERFIGTAEISNVPFSYSEAENIIESLDKLQAQIEENFKLQGDQLAFVKREIEYLKETVKRQGRKDWMHTAIGVIMTIAVGLALSPEKTKLLWDLLKSCFAGLLSLPAP